MVEGRGGDVNRGRVHEEEGDAQPLQMDVNAGVSMVTLAPVVQVTKVFHDKTAGDRRALPR